MTRGEASGLSKVHYQGKDDDFIVFLEDLSEFKKWQGDKSVPMVDFMANFDVYVTHKQGAEGNYDRASKASLENEFGSSHAEEAIKQILEKGKVQPMKGDARQGDTNINSGGRVAH